MMDRLTEIAKAAYESGTHSDCRLIMAASTQAALAAAFPPAESQPWMWGGTLPPLMQYHAIPVLLDNATEPGVWRLVNRSGDEVERGRVPVAVMT